MVSLVVYNLVVDVMFDQKEADKNVGCVSQKWHAYKTKCFLKHAGWLQNSNCSRGGLTVGLTRPSNQS